MTMRSRIYTIVLESNITYGSRSIYYSKPNLKSIQQSQNNILRLLYELPRNTSPQIIRIALGIIPIIAKIRANYLKMYFHCAVTCKRLKTTSYAIYCNLYNIWNANNANDRMPNESEALSRLENDLSNCTSIKESRSIHKMIWELRFYGSYKSSFHQSYLDNINYLLHHYNIEKYMNPIELTVLNKSKWSTIVDTAIYEYHYRADALFVQNMNYQSAILGHDFKFIEDDDKNYNIKFISYLDNNISIALPPKRTHRTIMKILFGGSKISRYRYNDNSKDYDLKECPYCFEKWNIPIKHILFECPITTGIGGNVIENGIIALNKLINFCKNITLL
eukprot:997494_1